MSARASSSRSSRCFFLAVASATIAILFLSATPEYVRAGERRGCEPPPYTGVASERLATLARGFNLTGWMSGETPRRPDQLVLASLRARGFAHIRLPVTAERLLTVFSSHDDVVRQLTELDAAVETLIGVGHGVSLDLHPGDRFGRLHVSDPRRGFELLETLWRLLARRYAGRSPDRLIFEVLYEPMIFTHQGLDWSNDPLRFLYGVPFPAHLTDPAVLKLIDSLVRSGRDESAVLLRSQLRASWTED